MRRSVIATASVVEEPIEPMPIKIKPYNHQVKGFNFCMKNDGFGLLYDVGLGKSLTAVAAAGARFQRGEVKKLLVICPLAVMPVWEREFENVTVPSVVCLLDGTMTQRLDTLRHFPNNETLIVAVINYEGARIMAEQLLKWKPDMLIVDESQRIKNPMSQQSKAVHKIAHAAKYRIILTATPIGNSVADVYSQWKVIDENLLQAVGRIHRIN